MQVNGFRRKVNHRELPGTRFRIVGTVDKNVHKLLFQVFRKLIAAVLCLSNGSSSPECDNKSNCLLAIHSVPSLLIRRGSGCSMVFYQQLI
jgi:hypothetical protein